MKFHEQKELLVLADEAISFGAIDAGVKGVFGYPGTPSTEAFEGAERIIHALADGRQPMRNALTKWLWGVVTQAEGRLLR